MKRTWSALLIAAGILVQPSWSMAGPKESFQKLVHASKTGNGIPEVVLSQAEMEALIDSARSDAKKRGKKLSREQAAILIGQIAGYTACAEAMKETSGGKNTRPVQQKRQGLPEPHVYKSGIHSYDAKAFVRALNTHEPAMKKVIEGNHVCLTGMVSDISSEMYQPNVKDLTKFIHDVPTVKIDTFSGYLVEDSFNPSHLESGKFVMLYCKDIQKKIFGAQGNCRIGGVGTRYENGDVNWSFMNLEIQHMLETPR